jgi:hypothetical protein
MAPLGKRATIVKPGAFKIINRNNPKKYLKFKLNVEFISII